MMKVNLKANQLVAAGNMTELKKLTQAKAPSLSYTTTNGKTRKKLITMVNERNSLILHQGGVIGDLCDSLNDSNITARDAINGRKDAEVKLKEKELELTEANKWVEHLASRANEETLKVNDLTQEIKDLQLANRKLTIELYIEQQPRSVLVDSIIELQDTNVQQGKVIGSLSESYEEAKEQVKAFDELVNGMQPDPEDTEVKESYGCETDNACVDCTGQCKAQDTGYQTDNQF